MRKLLKKIEAAFAAAAFAEEGEAETARQIVIEADREDSPHRERGARTAGGPARPRGVARPGKIARVP